MPHRPSYVLFPGVTKETHAYQDLIDIKLSVMWSGGPSWRQQQLFLQNGVRPLLNNNRVAEILPVGTPLRLVVMSEELVASQAARERLRRAAVRS